MNIKLFLALFALILTGCQSTPLKPYDDTAFKLTNAPGERYRVTLLTGDIKIGHSGWISAVSYENGQNPIYYCAEQGRHEWMGQDWMYTLGDQRQAVGHLTDILKANDMYDKSSSNEIVMHFISVSQGPQDQPVYTFEIELSILKSGQTYSKSNFSLTGNKMSEEYWTADSWKGAKKRATNRLLTQVIEHLNGGMASVI